MTIYNVVYGYIFHDGFDKDYQYKEILGSFSSKDLAIEFIKEYVNYTIPSCGIFECVDEQLTWENDESGDFIEIIICLLDSNDSLKDVKEAYNKRYKHV